MTWSGTSGILATTGLYLVEFNLYVTSPPGATLEAEVGLNGVAVGPTYTANVTTPSGTVVISGAVLLDAVAGDTVEILISGPLTTTVEPGSSVTVTQLAVDSPV